MKGFDLGESGGDFLSATLSIDRIIMQSESPSINIILVNGLSNHLIEDAIVMRVGRA
jgi:hypothetical protein